MAEVQQCVEGYFGFGFAAGHPLIISVVPTHPQSYEREREREAVSLLHNQ